MGRGTLRFSHDRQKSTSRAITARYSGTFPRRNDEKSAKILVARRSLIKKKTETSCFVGRGNR